MQLMKLWMQRNGVELETVLPHGTDMGLRSFAMLTATRCTEEREYASGEVVDPGVYIDLDTGSVVQMRATDELPEGSRVVRYQRRFKRVDTTFEGPERRRAA